MRRVWYLHLLLFLLLAAAGGMAWLTHHPDCPWLEHARDWPLLGPAAQALRQAYLPPDHPPRAVPPPRAEPSPPPAPRAAVTERLSPSPRAGLLGFEWFRAGTLVRREPRDDAPAVLALPRATCVPFGERSDAWILALPDVGCPPPLAEALPEIAASRLPSGVAGWVKVSPETVLADPPLGRDPAPPPPLPAQPPDPQRLAEARELMGRGGETAAGTPVARSNLGPYLLYTDSGNRALLDYLDILAGQAEEVYRRRYGLEPVGDPAEAVLLFERQAPYRRFQRREARLAHLSTSGHASRGLVALFVGGKGMAEVASTLLHELGHLLNRRALGPALPPWLDEGLAEDLAQIRLGPGGRLYTGLLGGEKVREGNVVTLRGGKAALALVLRHLRQGRLPAAQWLMALEWEEFVAPTQQQIHYAHAALWVRFLLDGTDPAVSAGWRAFLAHVAAGGEISAEELERHLRRSWTQLEADFRAWLLSEGQQLR